MQLKRVLSERRSDHAGERGRKALSRSYHCPRNATQAATNAASNFAFGSGRNNNGVFRQPAQRHFSNAGVGGSRCKIRIGEYGDGRGRRRHVEQEAQSLSTSSTVKMSRRSRCRLAHRTVCQQQMTHRCSANRPRRALRASVSSRLTRSTTEPTVCAGADAPSGNEGQRIRGILIPTFSLDLRVRACGRSAARRCTRLRRPAHRDDPQRDRLRRLQRPL